ncbi:MAG: alcohol dehydrogenase catalytic domain-containing protein [Pseudomonadota bacterium]
MQAAVLEAFGGAVTVQDVAEPDCPRDGVLIEVRACGICRSDHHAWKGVDPDVVLPHVMGHELAGVIVETGPDCHAWRAGARVTAPFILGCGTCGDCREGRATACDHQDVIGFTQWGAFAERVAVPHADFNLVALPDDLSFVAAAGMGCRVTTAWRALTDRADLKPGEWLAIHGAGGFGLSAIRLGVALGAQVVAVDVNPEALALAKAAGANATVNAADLVGRGDVGEAVRAATDGGAHVSIDGLGITATFENSLRSLRKLGRHVQVGMPVGPHATVPLPLLDLVYARQLTLHGMRGLAANRFANLMGLVAGGRFDPGALVTGTCGMADVGGVLGEMDAGTLTGIVVMEG